MDATLMSMGYRSEDGSRSRAGSGRQPARSSAPGSSSPGSSAPGSSAPGYGRPGDYDGYDPYDESPGRDGPGRHPSQPLSAPYPDAPYPEQGYGGTGGYDAHPGAANDWYADNPGNGNFTDPYGMPGTQANRDPVRGYPPAPELYPADGYQRFDADEYERSGSYALEPRFHDAPTYADAPYDAPAPYADAPAPYDAPMAYNDRAYGTGAYGTPPGQYDEAPYDRAFSGGGTGAVVRYQDDPYAERDEASFRDNGGPPPDRRPGRRTSGGSKRPSRLPSRTTLLSATAGIVALAVAATAYVLLTKSNPSDSANAGSTSRVQAPVPTASASASACATALGKYCHIETRVEDPQPLTLDEVFRAQFMNTSDGSSFAEAGQRIDKSCAGAIIGTNLQDAVKSGKCTQVLRASYVSGNGQIMGTIGVVNLVSTTAAEKAGQAVDANDFISPLSTSRGATKKLGQGTGVVEAEYKGHYLILMWAEYANLKTPSSSHQDHILEAFEQDLVSGTVNIALSERMVTGKPATAAS